MNKLRENQRGIIIEGLLIIIIIAVIAFIGWYVYNANKHTKNIYGQVNSSST